MRDRVALLRGERSTQQRGAGDEIGWAHRPLTLTSR